MSRRVRVCSAHARPCTLRAARARVNRIAVAVHTFFSTRRTATAVGVVFLAFALVKIITVRRPCRRRFYHSYVHARDDLAVARNRTIITTVPDSRWLPSYTHIVCTYTSF